ncbi:hypothetical protein EXN66_Car006472 [Channa argus]|uniref:Uncharacterized protein n=1 Tax=Channa argus TaxID=215402 RepID=A0A6G1PLE3_CHAAH|nr:hypothetical protein EXN66_Car006472 [Channa argus]
MTNIAATAGVSGHNNKRKTMTAEIVHRIVAVTIKKTLTYLKTNRQGLGF